MNNEKTSSVCEKKNAEGLREVGAEDCDPKDQVNPDQEAEPDSQPPGKPKSDIDDGGPLAI